MSARKLLTSFVLVVLSAAILAGCGRRGDPLTPYQAAVQAREDAEENDERPLPPQPERPREDRPFFLDPLI